MTAAGVDLARVRGLTLDLDDTLWPIWPAIERAERVLHEWLARHAPAVAQQFDIAALRALRDAVQRERPEWGHDLSRLRRESLVRALQQCGCDPALAVPAFDVFFHERNQLELYADAQAALASLAARYPLLALTNGNADLQRAGVAGYFAGCVSARDVGIAKPHARIFHLACERLGLAPDAVLHVGDDWALDIVGAQQAGLQTAWINRQGLPAPVPGTWELRDLSELAAALPA